ncbi:hypothetical protein AMECASPLE_017922 [Ameca splendens]|uniref:Uncharacterized protein n=1 Tax=Ameca splendens TaxID=208324 RepID=A0ABV0XRJ2_9TELE
MRTQRPTQTHSLIAHRDHTIVNQLYCDRDFVFFLQQKHVVTFTVTDDKNPKFKWDQLEIPLQSGIKTQFHLNNSISLIKGKSLLTVFLSASTTDDCLLPPCVKVQKVLGYTEQ